MQLLKKISDNIANGVDDKIAPLVIGIVGYGNVGKGVFEVLSWLQAQAINPSELHLKHYSNKCNYCLQRRTNPKI